MRLSSSVYMLAFCFSLLLYSTHSFSTPAQIAILRHAEEPSSGPDLSSRGYQRANALANYFSSRSEFIVHGNAAAIYAASPDERHPSMRSIETVTPLANKLHFSVLAPFARENTTSLIQEILGSPQYDGQFVVICWAHKQIPAIAHALGATAAPASWNETAFDRTWVIDFDHSGQVVQFRDIDQSLLPGDSHLN